MKKSKYARKLDKKVRKGGISEADARAALSRWVADRNVKRARKTTEKALRTLNGLAVKHASEGDLKAAVSTPVIRKSQPQNPGRTVPGYLAPYLIADPAMRDAEFNRIHKAAARKYEKQEPFLYPLADAAGERAQRLMMRLHERVWRTSDNPAEREASYSALMRDNGLL